MRAFQFLFFLSLQIKVKSKKFHSISNVLFRFLVTINEKVTKAILKNLNENIELYFAQIKHRITSKNVMNKLNDFLKKNVTMIKINSKFKFKIQQFYEKNFT